MKLVTYTHKGKTSCGLVSEGGLIDIPSNFKASDPPKSVLEILDRGPSCLTQVRQLAEGAHKALSLESVKLLAPIPRPGKVIALAGNYAEHIKEAALERGFKVGLSDSPRWSTVPRPFIMPATVIIGPEDTIPWPCYSETIDYELELAVVIGRSAKCVEPETALDHVAGYTIANDVSARSVTFVKNRRARPWDEFYDWLNGKWADGFLPTGPWLVTKDEIPDVQNLVMRLTVNGHVRQDASTSQMIYSVAEIVSFLSHLMMLEPGDIISTGTPAGVAMATGNFLKAGDRIKLTIEGLGTLSNTLGPRPDRFYEPLAVGKEK